MAGLTQINRPMKLRIPNGTTFIMLRVFTTAISDGVTATTDPLGSLAFDTTNGTIHISDGSLWQAAVVAGQSVGTGSSPTFANITDSGLTATRPVYSDGSKKLVSGPAGATAGPFTTITSITVVNGEVTAITGS